MRTLWFRISGILLLLCLSLSAMAVEPATGKVPVAALLASWFPGSHPDVILGRILRTYTLDGKGEPSNLQLVSIYLDRPQNGDITEKLAAEYNVKICKTMEEALTLGTGKLAVGGVVICTEWADYPASPLGATMYPHRLMFDEVVKVFKASGKVAPVFVDKHIAYNWEDSAYIINTAKKMKIPLMAGSSVPVSWRVPEVDVKRNAKLKEIVGISYHTLDGYSFHGLEMLQCLAERRKGGETGVKSVQCLTGQAVWDAAGKGYDPELLADALASHQPPLTLEKVKAAVKEPVVYLITYQDGLRAELFTLNGAVGNWASAWRYADGKKAATLFLLDESPKMLHFYGLMKGIEGMILTGKPSWPADRTLVTSGILDAALISKDENGRVVKTPYMAKLKYKSMWDWKQPDGLPGK